LPPVSKKQKPGGGGFRETSGSLFSMPSRQLRGAMPTGHIPQGLVRWSGGPTWRATLQSQKRRPTEMADFACPNRLTPQPLRHATREQDLVRWSRLCVSDVADMAFEPELQRKCVWPRRGQLHCVSLGGQIEYLRSEIFAVPLLLMSRIQSGDGAARTNAKHEEHKPFSHGSPSSPRWRFPKRLWILPTHLRQVAS